MLIKKILDSGLFKIVLTSLKNERQYELNHHNMIKEF